MHRYIGISSNLIIARGMRALVLWIVLLYLFSVTSIVRGGKNFVAQLLHDPKVQDEDGKKSGSGIDSAEEDQSSGDSEEESSEESEEDGDSSGEIEKENNSSRGSNGGKAKSPKKDRQNTGGGKIGAKGGWQETQAVVEANKEFSSKVYPAMVKAVGEDNNLICSILSLSTVLTMVREGSKGKTKEEMDSVLSLPDHGILEGYNAALEKFKSNEFYTIKAANKLYIGNDFELNQNYLTKTVDYFMAEAENIDFTREKETVGTINKWVEEKTNGKIKDLFSKLDPSTVMVLVNAIYFRADWESVFNQNNTRKSDFYLNPGETVQADTMFHYRSGTFRSYRWYDIDSNVLQMHYRGNKTAMYIFIQRGREVTGTNINYIEEKLSEFDYAVFQDGSQVSQSVHHMSLPKFKVETAHKRLVKVLSDAGMVSLFRNDADLSGISDVGLLVDQVVQKAFVEVDERGTEAAAASGISGVPMSLPIGPQNDFYVDTPFVFVIRCEVTGLILFQGRVTDPTK